MRVDQKTVLAITLAGCCAASLAVGSAAPTRQPSQSQPLFMHSAPSHFLGARPSFGWSHGRGMKRLMQYPTPIQHVVVIVLENRTVDNLFSGYYNQSWPSGGTWGQALDLYPPSGAAPYPALVEKPLAQDVDPHHSHQQSFAAEAADNWSLESFSCPQPHPHGCNGTPFVYTRPSDVSNYAKMITSWAFARNVLQSNEGPSFPAHQYLIAGQTGGFMGSEAPFAEDENPATSPATPTPAPPGDDSNSVDPDAATGGCNVANQFVNTVDMTQPYLFEIQQEIAGQNPKPFPCQQYPTTILDEVHQSGQSTPEFFDWQYIAHKTQSIWAAPLNVTSLYTEYNQNPAQSGFAVDQDAQQFVKDIGSNSPSRPFAHLTYITPCVSSSDHPNHQANDDGPQWLAWVVNAIGQSQYWPNTTVIVTWDDWGGWFDHYRAGQDQTGWPYHPFPNVYGQSQDPNEWGFRVPMIVISPYVRSRGYVSSMPAPGYAARSQGSILHYIEDTFNVPSMGTDDALNDDLTDMFDFSQQAPGLPYVHIPTNFRPYKC